MAKLTDIFKRQKEHFSQDKEVRLTTTTDEIDKHLDKELKKIASERRKALVPEKPSKKDWGGKMSTAKADTSGEFKDEYHKDYR